MFNVKIQADINDLLNAKYCIDTLNIRCNILNAEPHFDKLPLPSIDACKCKYNLKINWENENYNRSDWIRLTGRVKKNPPSVGVVTQKQPSAD